MYTKDSSCDESIKELVDEVGLRQAATVVLGTKANWWLTNHHVGQGEMTGYA
jgi:hypothetical protein